MVPGKMVERVGVLVSFSAWLGGCVCAPVPGFMAADAASLERKARNEFIRRHGPSCTSIETEWIERDLGSGLARMHGTCGGTIVTDYITVTNN